MITHSTGKLSSKDLYESRPRYDVLLIGSGLASLTSAALLAQSGRKVCILEAQAGPSYPSSQAPYLWGCGPGGKVHSFLKKLGLEDEILFDPLEGDGYDHVLLPDRQRVKLACGYDNLADNIEAAYPGQGEGVRRFTSILERLEREVAQLPEKIQWWQVFTQGYRFTTLLRYHRATLQQVLDECRVGAEAQAVLAANVGNFMCPPDELSILAYNGLFSGYNRGAFAPREPVSHLTDRLIEYITSHPGSHLYYEAEVTQVHTSGDYVDQVVTAGGRRFTAPTILCNADAQKMSEVIGREKFPSAYLRPIQVDSSPAAVTCRLRVRGLDLRDYGFGEHNTWHLEQWDMNRSWDEAMGGDWSRPSLLIATPSLQPGHQVLDLVTAANYDFFHGLKQLDVGDYKRKKAEVQDRLIDLVEAHHVPNLRKHLQPVARQDSAWTPRGQAWGQRLVPRNMGIGRLKSRTPWNNFFWCNASCSYPGLNGMLGAGMQLYMELTGDRFWSDAQILETRPSTCDPRQVSFAPALG